MEIFFSIAEKVQELRPCKSSSCSSEAVQWLCIKARGYDGQHPGVKL